MTGPESEAAAAYFAAARGRPEWVLWGKAQPDHRATAPAHPLLFHMLDVATVAQELLECLPAQTERLLLDLFPDTPRDCARRWLGWVVALHDLGKATPDFQAKWSAGRAQIERSGFDIPASRMRARDHGTAGAYLVAQVLQRVGAGDRAQQLARAVAAHHGTFPSDVDLSRPPFSSFELGRAEAWSLARERIPRLLLELFGLEAESFPAGPTAQWGRISALAGFTSVADWIGSMAEFFVYEPPGDGLSAYVQRARDRASLALSAVGFRRRQAVASASFESLFGLAPRPLQEVVGRHAADASTPSCVIVEAPMGEGKTEAALYASHVFASRDLADGVYIGLPTQATANQMFDRLEAFLRTTRPKERTNLQLLHGEAAFDVRVSRLLRAVYDPRTTDGGVVSEAWFLGKKRALLASFGAGTIDQALLGVLRTRHAFVRQLGLAGKTVVLDEVHAYDAYTSQLLERLIAWLGALGANVLLMSATLPSARRVALLEAYAGRSLERPAHVSYPRMTAVDRTGGVSVRPFEVGRPSFSVEVTLLAESDDVASTPVVKALAASGGCVAVLRNTVTRAQETYRRLREARQLGILPPETQLLLLHARFPAEERRVLERRLVALVGKTAARPDRAIIVGTQVLEQSLDVDFDALVTDIAPVDLVLQRAGRVHRHQRSHRPPAFVSPRLCVVVPGDDASTTDLSPHSAVYESLVLRRSWRLLEQRSSVRLPDDIEPLVEAVYGPDAGVDGDVVDERHAFEARVREDALLARERAWPMPRGDRDPFADLFCYLEDADQEIARALRAETRLGEPSCEVVCLFGSAARATLDAEGLRPVDVGAPPDRDVVRALAGRTLRVATPALVRAIEALAPVDAWKDVSVLARRRVLFFDGTPLRVGDMSLTLDPELGLLVEKAKESSR